MHLSELQQQFMLALKSESRASIPIAPSKSLQAHERLAIYQGMVKHRIVEAVFVDFPRLTRRLGQKKLRRWISEFLDDHPPNSYSLNWASLGFADFIRSRVAPLDYEVALIEERDAITCLYPVESQLSDNPQTWVLKRSVMVQSFSYAVYEWFENPELSLDPRSFEHFAVLLQDPLELGLAYAPVDDRLHQVMLEKMYAEGCSFVEAAAVVDLEDPSALSSIQSFAEFCGRYALLTSRG